MTAFVADPMTHQSFTLCACLPFVELAQEASIQIGPVIFWPASKAQEFLPAHASTFQTYLESIGQIKARSKSEKEDFVNTVRLSPAGMTCASIDSNISPELYEYVLIDSLYLLYFACTFRNLYYGQEIPTFNAFRKMIPASMDFIHHRHNWEQAYIDETSRENTICIHLVDPEICQGLGKALEAIYIPTDQNQELIPVYKRLVRSIRYLVDRFFQRFVNLFDNGLNFSEELFEPEDVIFLASSFETLFDINEKQPAADFKHKLRPLLHLKYGRPVELFWKWVDNFYEVKRQIVHGNMALDPLFRLNPNFEISHTLLGIKLFIYSIYYTLYKYQLMHSTHEDPYTPPDFKWIHPEEVLLFFWTETNLLRKLSSFLRQISLAPQKEELYADIHLLTNLFVSLYERYYLDHPANGARFIPTPLGDLEGYGAEILGKLKQITDVEDLLLTVIHPQFIQSLEDRLQRKQT